MSKENVAIGCGGGILRGLLSSYAALIAQRTGSGAPVRAALWSLFGPGVRRGLHLGELLVIFCLREMRVFALLTILLIGADSFLKELIAVVWNSSFSWRTRS